MNNRKALYAGIIGAFSTIAAEIVTRIFVWLGVGKFDDYQLNSLLATINEPSIPLGMIINFIIGFGAGITLYLLVEKTGKEFIIIKSLVFGLLIWFVFESMFTAFYEGLLHTEREIGDHYVHLAGTTAYSITQGLLFKFVLYKDNTGEQET